MRRIWERTSWITLLTGSAPSHSSSCQERASFVLHLPLPVSLSVGSVALKLTFPVDSYRTVPLSFIQNELAFDTLSQTREFIEKHGAGFWNGANTPDEQRTLQCREAQAPLVSNFETMYRKVQIKGAV